MKSTLKLPEILVSSKEKCLSSSTASPRLSRCESASCPCSMIPKCAGQALIFHEMPEQCISSCFHPQSIWIKNLNVVICGLLIYHNCHKNWKCHLVVLNAKYGLNLKLIKTPKRLLCCSSLQGWKAVCVHGCSWTGRVCFLLQKKNTLKHTSCRLWLKCTVSMFSNQNF